VEGAFSERDALPSTKKGFFWGRGGSKGWIALKTSLWVWGGGCGVGGVSSMGRGSTLEVRQGLRDFTVFLKNQSLLH